MTENDRLCANFEQEYLLLLDEDLPETRADLLRSHLTTCEQCSNKAREMETVLNGYSELPVPSVDDARWSEMVDKAMEESISPGTPPHPRPSIGRLFPLAAALLIGFLLGSWWRTPGVGELASLRDELAGLRTELTLNALRDRKAAIRLEGVALGVSQRDAVVFHALLTMLDHDPNLNVRIAVIQALQSYRDEPRLQPALFRAFEREDSPIARFALIDVLSDLDNPESRRFLEKLVADPTLSEEMRDHIEYAMKPKHG